MRSHMAAGSGRPPVSALKKRRFPIRPIGTRNALMVLLGTAGWVTQTCLSDSGQGERVVGAVSSLALRCPTRPRWRWIQDSAQPSQ